VIRPLILLPGRCTVAVLDTVGSKRFRYARGFKKAPP
jgi:hypothetical protein